MPTGLAGRTASYERDENDAALCIPGVQTLRYSERPTCMTRALSASRACFSRSRHVVGSCLMVLILNDENGVGHEPGDVHTEVLEVPLRFLVDHPVGADYYWQGALPVGINLTFIIGIEGPGLHHANVNRLVAVGQEDVWPLAGLACSTQVFCSWITVYFLRETRWSYSQHTIASWRITLYRCVCLQLSMWSSLIFVPQRVQLELRSQSAATEAAP